MYKINRHAGAVELIIERGKGQKTENKAIFDKLFSEKAAIESACGADLVWDRLDNKQSCRIRYSCSSGGYLEKEEDWLAIHDEMIDAMTRLEKAFRPHVEALKL